MEKKERAISVFAESNYGTKIQIIVEEKVDDLIYLIYRAINKIEQLEKKDEKFKIVHIDSIRRQKIKEL